MTKKDFHFFSPQQMGFTHVSKQKRATECSIVKIQNGRGKCLICKANCYYKCKMCGALCKGHALSHLD